MEENDSGNFKFQRELIYNKLLPYADKLEDESQAFLIEIKGNLRRAVMLRELYPGAAIWSKRLFIYIDVYGYKFTKEDHIAFIKLMYELLIIPKLHQKLFENFARTLCHLLRKISLISPDELELPWKPLFEIYHHMNYNPKNDNIYRYNRTVQFLLYSIIQVAKNYFPLSATQEILEELRPTLCPFDQFSTEWSIKSLELFLPLKLRPEHHSFGFYLWFEELMDFWEKCSNSPQWEAKMMSLMGNLAYNNIGYINWEPYLPIMFTRILRSLHLPVSYQKVPNRKEHNMGTFSSTPMALWIVSVLGKNSKAQTYLDKFLKTIETYYRSVNCGEWTRRLKNLLEMSDYFILRLQRERYRKPTWIAPIPDDHKLTDDDIDAFVKSVIPIAMTAMYNLRVIEAVCTTLRHLANIRPNLVIPGILERMYSTLDSVTEPYKFIAAMMSVISVARPLVQGPRNINKGYTFSEGPIHVMPLLFSFLPGIDPNDSQKTYVTFRLLSVFSKLIPVVDCSRSTESMNEEDRLICESTSRFEDFVLQFLDRMFLLIDSSSLEFVRLENHGEDKKSKAETFAESTVAEICKSLFAQTSDTIFECALHKLRVFISEHILETRVAGQLAAILCKTFARVNGRSTLRALFPFLSQTILDTIAENEDIVNEENLDNRLLYCMLILTGILETSGNNLIPYIDKLQKILDRALYLKSKQGNNLACKMLKCILHNLSYITPYKFQSCERDYNDPDYSYIKDWGQAPSIKSLKLEWYVPGKEEISIIQGIFSRYLLPEINKLQKYCEDPNSLTREKLLISLNIVHTVISNCEPLLPVWEEPAIILEETCSPATPFIPTFGSKGELLMPDGSNVRQYIANFMHNLQKVILENAEDDTKSLALLIQILSSLLGRNDRSEIKYKVKLKQLKALWEDKLTNKGKSYMGSAILRMAVIIHEKNMQLQSHVMTETHKRIILQLFQLATSRYADVRMKAQKDLFETMQIFPTAHLLLLPSIIDILGTDVEAYHDAHKGALYTLLGPLPMPIVTTPNWHVLKSLWPAIILSKPSEKPSVIALKDEITNCVSRRFYTTGIELDVPESCVEIAGKLWDVNSPPLIPRPNEAEIEEGLRKLASSNRDNVVAYKELLDKLQNTILEKSLHWRHRLMAMYFIKNAVSPEQMYPSKIVRYFVGALIHDSLPEREIAIRTVVCMLKQQKRKHPKITVDVSTLSKKFTSPKNQRENFGTMARSDNLWLQYDYDTRPLTVEQWDEPRYVHLSFIGFYAWPKKLEVYAPSHEQPTLDPKVRKMTDLEAEVDLFFSNEQNVEKLVKFYSLDRKKDSFRVDTNRIALFQGLFRNHGDAYLRYFITQLKKLIADKQEDSLVLAAEIIAGIIRGSKHWPFQMVQDMWAVLLPVLKSALPSLTAEVENEWCQCLMYGLIHRDPNRYHWILEFLMEASRPDATKSSFVECIQLNVIDKILTIYSWRVSQLFERMLQQLEGRFLSHPFNNVRESLAHGLATVFASELRSFDDSSCRLNENVRKLMEKMTPVLQKLADDFGATFNTDEESLSLRVEDVKLSDSNSDTKTNGKEREEALSLLKSACSLIIGVAKRSQYGILPEFYEWFPIICQLKNYETDKELVQQCTATLAVLAYALTLPRDIPIVLESVTKISKNPSWWTRITCLEFLQVLVFKNMSIILSNPAWVNTVQDIVLYLLNDDRLEVRQKSADILGELLHCAFIPDPESLLDDFKRRAKTKLRKGKSNNEPENSAKMQALRVRHAGVLGLCAFIRAHPYDIPKYLPPIFEHLSYNLGDPQPIAATIRQTMTNFKRTHYDGWYGINGHAEQFTEEQLAVLQDLAVPPSDYA